jgi:type I restriction enzyme S subunit
MGYIPSHWVETSLKRYCDVTDGSHHSPKVRSSGIPFISVTDVGTNDINFADSKKISYDDYIRLAQEGCKPKTGDVLLTKDGTIGRAAIVKESFPDFVILSSLGLLSPSSNLSNNFLYYYLVSGINVDQMNSLIHGSALRRMTIGKIDELLISIPPLGEQQQIANFLDHETAKIDTLIDKQQQLIKLLKEKRQAVISHAVTKGLNPNVPMKDSGVEWLGEVPEHWNVSSLKYFWNILDCKHITADFVDEGIPLASIREVKSWYVDLASAKKTTDRYYELLIEGNRQPKAGDVIYSRNATVGEAALVPSNIKFAMGQDVCLLSKISEYNSEFLLHQLKSPVIKLQLERLLIGSTFKRINVEEIRNFVICVPPATEQDKISLYLQDKVSRYNTLIGESEKAIRLSKERRTALISAAVTGKIDVRNWQPENPQPSTEANA